MENPTCGACRFFTRPGMPGDKYGACIRYPQQHSKHETEWCGEFQQIKTDAQFREPKPTPPPMRDLAEGEIPKKRK